MSVMTFLVFLGSTAVKVETVTLRSEQAGRSHKKGRVDYRLREGSLANLRVYINS